MPSVQGCLAKLEAAPKASFHVLDPAKAARMKAKTLYIPSPQDVAKAIRSIPEGQTRTILDLRQMLARKGKAETACPATTIKYWKWLATVAPAADVGPAKYFVPWWRVMKDGKPSRHMPGGIAGQRALLRAEGVAIQ